MSRSRRRCLIASLAVTVLCVSSTAHAQSPAPERTVAAQGAASVTVVKPKDRTHEGPIHAAVEAAEAKALPRAIADARSKAAELARLSGHHARPDRGDLRRAGLALRAIHRFYSRFGPDRFCGTVRTTVFKTSKTTGKRVRVGTRSRHICQIPPTVVSTVTVTFAA